VAGVVLEGLVLEGRIFTMDALLTQRALAQQIVAGGGDYVMLAKGNQPTLEQDIATVFTAPPSLGSSASTPAPRTRGTDGWSGVN
jgi:predicted transposase YbfD/YdcC